MPASSPYTHDPTAQSSSGSLVNRHKRRGVALSCAECRRLKLKCSRQFPCSNCVKKGCSAICPDGSLTTGKGNRFVLANTEVLHDKINLLANRVRALEDALAQSHSLNSNGVHPLLTEELLQIKRPLERERPDEASKEGKSEGGETIDALGSLSISQSGRSTFFGTAANSWYLLQIEEGSDEEETLSSQYAPHMPQDLPWLSHGFPFTSAVNKTSEAVRASITSHLPAPAAAKRIANLYFRHAAWMYTPISEQDFYSNVLPEVYNTEETYRDSVSSHTLSVFFMVLALGTLLDLDLPAHSPESMQYFQIGRAALALDSVLEEQSITALQALLLMCHFMFLSDMAGPRWVLMGIVVKVAQSIGLHRDSGKWKLDPEETQKRRQLFYEILTYDSWQSLTFGRPPSLSMVHIDSKLPNETVTTPTGDVEMTFAAWKHSFSAECLSVVHDQAFGTKAPSYSVIQELDTKVRNWYVPPSLMVPGFGNSKISGEVEQPSIELTMQRYTAFAIREITLFYMHRGFFAQALEDNPNDPMGSKYAPSVLAAYRSAMTFVALIESLFKQHPQLTERMWFLFTHVFSCAIVLGSIAVKSRMQLAPSALTYLDLAYQLFDQVSDTTRTSKILPILQKMRDRAQTALSGAASNGANGALPNDPASRLAFFSPPIKTEETEMTMELSALGGMTRLVARRTTPSSPSCSTSNPSSPSQQPSSPPISAQTNVMSPYTPLSDASSSSSWQNYTHIQNLNVNINVGDYASYSGPSGASSQSPMGYGGYHQHQQAQHHQPSSGLTQPHPQQQQQSHMQQNGMGIEAMAEYYPYNGYPMQAMMNQGECPPINDMDYPWHNLVAQTQYNCK
ncbi:hypothetical protein CC1G_09022 [Coprinopsis cinerea okayama7|uniref:Zn(2)-C6 fungal-type domain-containing protein n=1 Tax=Coprinopsis cinerea (strain Okayama-7 / 130 / ATCC MYA-4618 / FGSC 9003) TaxID=240176 RepID=A8N9I7_COPC7|nr:hypothetical protein CC1G_09022 [Coprinopsis cinerea okayama7\|eukprot:XP_001831493.1 hypothetical protein CC1G_09022 [Coprinopsis cinerea okayama7\